MKSISFKRKHLSIPYVIFLIGFVVIPVLFIFYYAFSNKGGSISFNNVSQFFSDSTNVNVLLISLVYAILNTLFCLIIAYPLALFLANSKINKSKAIVMMFIMPMWINFIIRTSATRDVLIAIGISTGEYSHLTTMIGLVYNYLPFVILPLYSTMLKMDKNQIEASYDLGANKVQTFIKVIIPMTFPGLISAATMVFMPTLSSYVISDLLSEYNVVLFGSYIDLYFNQANWNFGSFMAFIMLLLILFSVFISRKFGEKSDEGRASLW